MCAVCVSIVTSADPIKFTTDASSRTQKADPEANILQSAQIWGFGSPQRMICSSSYVPDYSLTSSVRLQVYVHHSSAQPHRVTLQPQTLMLQI